MNINQAKNTAWSFAGKYKQEMYVVQRGQQYFAASKLDLQRQFSRLQPLFTYPYPR